MKNIIFPWNDSLYPEDRPADKLNIYNQLKRLGYPTDKYKGDVKDKQRLTQVVSLILDELKKSSWILLLSNSSSLNHSVSELLPITFALTYTRSVYNIDNTILEELTSWKVGEDVMDAISEAMSAGLIVFNNFGERTKKIANSASSVVPLFESRLKRNKNIVLLCSYSTRNSNKAKEELTSSLVLTYGQTISSLVLENCKFIHFKTSEINISWEEPIDRSSDR